MARNSQLRSFPFAVISVAAGVAILYAGHAPAQDDVLVVGGTGWHCGEDPQCFNRLHPDIPMAARALPGQTILLRTRNSADLQLDPDSTYVDPRDADPVRGTVHPLTGPVHIEGAEPGDVLAVTILDIDPGPFGATRITPNAFIADHIPGPFSVTWRLNRREAISDALPGVRIPNASFPGIVTVLPGPDQHAAALEREAALSDAGGAVGLPQPIHASPAEICGPQGSRRDECLRTGPPREHGGNMDIRYMSVGVTVYLPCYVEGCGLGVGDLHFAQGDGEVAGTAIEMDADVTLTTELIKDGPELLRGPHYEGTARLMDVPSRRFYATTGLPLKAAGEIPPDMAYLESPKAGELENLSKDISLAARNALLEIIDYMVANHGLTPEQAYVVASVAVDLRIGQLVDVPNVGVTAILPLDVFD
ncbi:MAG: acetamidase/formamidase family protein [Proteobacteria bacterium]|nr:acetamidase/formamidase family protein [Pseudomonadota bacterium]MYJ97134.1 acetamidase/formamidase family protein [Pseudomonadota bacterium]